jgi:hypothetical protein
VGADHTAARLSGDGQDHRARIQRHLFRGALQGHRRAGAPGLGTRDTAHIWPHAQGIDQILCDAGHHPPAHRRHHDRVDAVRRDLLLFQRLARGLPAHLEQRLAHPSQSRARIAAGIEQVADRTRQVPRGHSRCACQRQMTPRPRRIRVTRAQ